MRYFVFVLVLVGLGFSQTSFAGFAGGYHFYKVANGASDRPDKGMSMKRVLRRFGEPVEKLPPAGKPPITRWIYEDFTVYFENNYVIHAVEKRKRLPK